MSDIMQGRDANIKFCPTPGTITTANSTVYAQGAAYAKDAIVSFNLHFYKALAAIATGDNTSSAVLSDATKFEDLGLVAPSTMTAPTNTISFLSNANSWDISKEIDVKEYSVFGNDGYKKKATTVQSWSASVKAYFDADDTNGQMALINAFDKGKKIFTEYDVNAYHCYQGNAFIKSLKTGAAAEGEVSFDIELEGDSKLFYK